MYHRKSVPLQTKRRRLTSIPPSHYTAPDEPKHTDLPVSSVQWYQDTFGASKDEVLGWMMEQPWIKDNKLIDFTEEAVDRSLRTMSSENLSTLSQQYREQAATIDEQYYLDTFGYTYDEMSAVWEHMKGKRNRNNIANTEMQDLSADEITEYKREAKHIWGSVDSVWFINEFGTTRLAVLDRLQEVGYFKTDHRASNIEHLVRLSDEERANLASQYFGISRDADAGVEDPIPEEVPTEDPGAISPETGEPMSPGTEIPPAEPDPGAISPETGEPTSPGTEIPPAEPDPDLPVPDPKHPGVPRDPPAEPPLSPGHEIPPAEDDPYHIPGLDEETQEALDEAMAGIDHSTDPNEPGIDDSEEAQQEVGERLPGERPTSPGREIPPAPPADPNPGEAVSEKIPAQMDRPTNQDFVRHEGVPLRGDYDFHMWYLRQFDDARKIFEDVYENV